MNRKRYFNKLIDICLDIIVASKNTSMPSIEYNVKRLNRLYMRAKDEGLDR